MSKQREYQAIVIDWTGPVSWETLESMDSGGLYIFTGKRRHQRNTEIQYIGITEQTYAKRFNYHHKAGEITRNLNCWVGKVRHPPDLTRAALERAESMLIYILDPPLNERKKVTIPHPTSVISHWFTEKGDPRYNRQGIFKGFPDVISWDGANWREGNLRVWDAWK